MTETWCASCRAGTCGAHKRETLKVRVELTIEIDVDEYRMNYGTDKRDVIRSDVKWAVRDAAQATFADGIRNVELLNP